jgi:Family of unknown function (DUF6496)
MAKYGKAASKRVASAMRRRKRGTLKSGSGRRVKSRTQAIAIGLSEAREKGAKVPARKRSSKRSGGSRKREQPGAQVAMGCETRRRQPRRRGGAEIRKLIRPPIRPCSRPIQCVSFLYAWLDARTARSGRR